MQAVELEAALAGVGDSELAIEGRIPRLVGRGGVQRLARGAGRTGAEQTLEHHLRLTSAAGTA